MSVSASLHYNNAGTEAAAEKDTKKEPTESEVKPTATIVVKIMGSPSIRVSNKLYLTGNIAENW